jgi:hypothetical protein
MKWTMQQKGNNLCVPNNNNNNNNIDKTKKNREKTFYCLVAERE